MKPISILALGALMALAACDLGETRIYRTGNTVTVNGQKFDIWEVQRVELVRVSGNVVESWVPAGQEVKIGSEFVPCKGGCAQTVQRYLANATARAGQVVESAAATSPRLEDVSE